MSILISWLIANLEKVTNILFVIIFELFLFGTDLEMWGDSKAEKAVLVPVLMVFIRGMLGGLPAKSASVNFLNLGIIVIAWLIGVFVPGSMSYAITMIIIAIIMALACGVFVNNNFQDVVSRRMLYINDNVSMFEQKWVLRLQS